MIGMNDKLLNMAAGREKSRYRYGQSVRFPAGAGFTCIHCGVFVSTQSELSGVGNRNHCPLCLWSRHLDLYAAGDRLSACKAPMRSIGLTIKAAHKKYGPGWGELMLVHRCCNCEMLSINRIAADDDPDETLRVFENSFQLDAVLKAGLRAAGVHVLDRTKKSLIQDQLFGHESSLAEMLFKSSVMDPA